MEQITQLTSMCELVCQIVQKKQEEKRIEEEQAAKARYWKIPVCCDDDDYDSAITLVLSTEEPIDSLSMGDEHLDTIPATESDEVIKFSVEDLVPILSESEGLKYGRYGVFKVLDTAYRGFLEVGTTFISSRKFTFYNLNMAYWSSLDMAYWILFPSSSLVIAGTDTPYLP
nr:hypothetical protein [Tanacetum cinerariifolium]